FGDRGTRLIRQRLAVSLIRPTSEFSDPPNALPCDDAELRQQAAHGVDCDELIRDIKTYLAQRMPIRSLTPGAQKLWRSSPRSNALVQHSTRTQQDEFLHGNSESGH